MTFRFRLEGAEQTIVNLRIVRRRQVEASKLGVWRAGAFLWDQVRENSSYRTYSLGQLAAKDHPYAQRHGSIQVRLPSKGGRTMIADPRNYVHTRSGSFLSAIRGQRKNTPNGPMFKVWADAGRSQNVKRIILGTRRMLPRDVLGSTAASPLVQGEMVSLIEKALEAAFKVNVGGSGFLTGG